MAKTQRSEAAVTVTVTPPPSPPCPTTKTKVKDFPWTQNVLKEIQVKPRAPFTDFGQKVYQVWHKSKGGCNQGEALTHTKHDVVQLLVGHQAPPATNDLIFILVTSPSG